MTKYFRGISGVSIIFILTLTGCATVTSPVSSGEVKISYFYFTEVVKGKNVEGNYMAIVSPEWKRQWRKKLNEPFEQLKLPPNLPTVKMARDEVMMELVELMEKEGFYQLVPCDLKRYTIDKLNDPNFRTRVLTIERNGLSVTAALEDQPAAKKETFIWLTRIFNKNFLALTEWESGIDFDKDLQRVIEEQKKRQEK